MHRIGSSFALVAALLSCTLLPQAAESTPAVASSLTKLPDATTEKVEIERWQAERRRRLTSDTGWLTLVGLYWLEQGKSTLGRDPKNAIRIDHPALAPFAGEFQRDGKIVRFVARNGGLLHNQKPVTSIELVADTQKDPTVLESGPLSFTLIERSGQYGIRVRDRGSAARRHFSGLQYFPATTDWVFDARFEPYVPARQMRILNVLGMEEDLACPGALVFVKDGQEHRLDAVIETPGDTELFVMFADATNGKETYGAGRFMYVPMPHQGFTRLDFNKSYNPPCAFSNFSTCPLPPPQNRLPVRVEAGEKTYVDGQHSP